MALRHNLLSPSKRGSRAVREAAVAQLEVAEVAALTEEAAAPMVELVVVRKGAVHVAARMRLTFNSRRRRLFSRSLAWSMAC